MTGKVLEIDCLTNTVELRDETTAEKTARLKAISEAEATRQARIEAAEAKAVARQAVLDKLGLTADEAEALFG